MAKDLYDKDGYYIGRRDDDGSIYDKDGYYKGKIESDGTIRDKDGYYDGRIEEDGTIRDKDGYYNGRKESDGTIRDRDGYYDGKEKEQSGCFISTACIEAKGLPDNCKELTVLRSFRDNWLAEIPGGRSQIERYYRVAPGIVKKINGQHNSHEVYVDLYKRLVERTVDLINAGNMAEAYSVYKGIVDELLIWR